MIFDLLLSFALKCIAVFCFVFNLLSFHLARATWQGYKTRLTFPKKPFTNQNRTRIHKQKPIVSILRATTFTIFHLFCFCLFRVFVYLFRFLCFSLSSSAFWRLITILVTDFSWPFHCQFLDFVFLSLSLFWMSVLNKTLANWNGVSPSLGNIAWTRDALFCFNNNHMFFFCCCLFCQYNQLIHLGVPI